jgi:deoxyribonuclease V
MKLNEFNRWDLAPAEAVQVQKELAEMVRGGQLGSPNNILGLDVSYSRMDGTFRSVAVMVNAGTLETIDSWSLAGRTTFPYVPGLLSFREIPPLLPLLKKVPKPDLIIADGQGTAHPRGLGLASHIGLVTGVPTIGCAKSLLVGRCLEPGPDPGDRTPIDLNGRTAGYALRSKRKCKPLYVSPGHRLDPGEAVKGVLMCLKGYRLPEPTRLADRLSKEKG